MHRSGTSALAGSLEEHGLFLGDVSTKNPHNPRGNRESTALRRLNADVLASSGGSWDAPPDAVVWQEEHYARARALLAEHAGAPVWGFKDPRTLLALDGWLALVPDLEFAGIFRHPGHVARSLERRDGMQREAAEAVWIAYNTPLVELARARGFPLVCFDDEPAELQRKFVQVAQALRLERSDEEERFFVPELRAGGPTAKAGPAAQALYEDLLALAL